MSKIRESAMADKRITKECLNCNGAFTVPQCRDWREHCCSSECKTEYKAKKQAESRQSRERVCVICSSIFYPRRYQLDLGQGRYCSLKCSMRYALSQRKYRQPMPEEERKRKNREYARTNKSRQDILRRLNYSLYPEKHRERLRKYRNENPEKVREWSQKRSSYKTKRLPRGTVSKLLSLQRWKCAICKESVKSKYHVDHIQPLAQGGAHSPENIQILCPSCNVRKSAKDPIKYMQERGYLL